jgi:hypothetical protein
VAVARGASVGLGVRVADGVSVSAGNKAAVGIGVDTSVTVGLGAGEKSRFATEGPNKADAAVNVNNTNDAISHCQPVIMRARRVR